MAIEKVDNCVSCGMLPCYHCEAIVFICDACGEESEDLYWYGEEQLCEDCWKDASFNNDAKKVDEGW